MKRLFLVLFVSFFAENVIAQEDDWTTYGKDSGGGHYSKASEINIDTSIRGLSSR